MDLTDVETLFETNLTAVGTFVTNIVTDAWPYFLGALGLSICAYVLYRIVRTPHRA